MSGRTFNLDDLVGREVHDASGHRVGRIFDVRAEERDGALEVVEYFVGTAAMLQRHRRTHAGTPFTDPVGVGVARPPPR